MKYIILPIIIIFFFLFTKAELQPSDRSNLYNDLDVYGVPVFYNYNGNDSNSFVIVIVEFTDTESNRDSVVSIIGSYLTNEGFSKIHLGINSGVLKTEWTK